MFRATPAFKYLHYVLRRRRTSCRSGCWAAAASATWTWTAACSWITRATCTPATPGCGPADCPAGADLSVVRLLVSETVSDLPVSSATGVPPDTGLAVCGPCAALPAAYNAQHRCQQCMTLQRPSQPLPPLRHGLPVRRNEQRECQAGRSKTNSTLSAIVPGSLTGGMAGKRGDGCSGHAAAVSAASQCSGWYSCGSSSGCLETHCTWMRQVQLNNSHVGCLGLSFRLACGVCPVLSKD